jgi:hypothetical protein
MSGIGTREADLSGLFEASLLSTSSELATRLVLLPTLQQLVDDTRGLSGTGIQGCLAQRWSSC